MIRPLSSVICILFPDTWEYEVLKHNFIVSAPLEICFWQHVEK